jgi:uncharacterized protein (TIGR02217 family)
MTFHNVRLPDDVEKGASGGPRFNTFILPLSSGKEKRRIGWERQRGKWDIGYGLQYKDDADLTDGLNRIITFFYARRGRAYSFRFKDWSDYQMNKQVIGIGNGTEDEFQIFKRYTSGGINFDRIIALPIFSTVQVWVNGVLKTVSVDYTVGLTTGLILFTAPVTNTHAVEVACEFDVHVRFDTDDLDISMSTFQAGAIPSIPIIEVKPE